MPQLPQSATVTVDGPGTGGLLSRHHPSCTHFPRQLPALERLHTAQLPPGAPRQPSAAGGGQVPLLSGMTQQQKLREEYSSSFRVQGSWERRPHMAVCVAADQYHLHSPCTWLGPALGELLAPSSATPTSSSDVVVVDSPWGVVPDAAGGAMTTRSATAAATQPSPPEGSGEPRHDSLSTARMQCGCWAQ